MTGTSHAAVATIKVSPKALESDALLSLILSLTNQFQIKTDLQTKSKKVECELSTQENTVKISNRNAILRSLCGMTLHNALDRKYFLLGGCATGSDEGVEESVFITNAITSWMSVAASASTSVDDITQLIDHLDSVLEKQSFLVRSPGASLADLDMFFLLKKHDDAIFDGKLNVSRWFRQVHASALSLISDGCSARPDLAKYIKLEDLPVIRSSAPVFFYGNDDEQQIRLPSSIPSKKKAAAVGSNSDNNKKDQSKEAPTKAPTTEGNELSEEQKKAAAEKRAKKNAEKAAKKKKTAKQQPAPKPVSDLNISALDIRVGKITKVWNHETADKLYCEEVDVGEDKPRNIASGLRPFYKLEDMDQQNVLVLCNLKARSLVGFPSHGMVLCASSDDHTKVQFVIPPEGSKIGERVLFEGYEGEPESESRVNKKKIFEALAPFLKTDKSGGVTWKESKGVTSAGQCFAIQKMSDAHVA